MIRIWLIGFLALVCMACQREDNATYSPLGPIPPSSQRLGDPARGREALLNEAYITCGMPESAYRRTAPSRRLNCFCPNAAAATQSYLIT